MIGRLRWARTWTGLGATPPGDAARSALVAAWREPHRAHPGPPELEPGDR